MAPGPDSALVGWVLVVADDLIWSTRLVSLAERAGAAARSVRDEAGLRAALADDDAAAERPALVVVDAGARSFDGPAAVAEAARAGVPVIAIGPHEDIDLRKRALQAGARRVYANSKMHSDGVRLLGEWLAAASGERPGIGPERYAERLAAARDRLGAASARALLVGPGPDLRYLAGYDAPELERLTLLVLPAEGDGVLIVPRLERERAAGAAAVGAGLVELRSWEETEDPLRLVAAALGGGRPLRGRGSPSLTAWTGRLLVGDRLWATFLLGLQEAFRGTRFGLASEVLRGLRMRKDAEEVALLRAAAHAADRVLAAIAAGPLIGRSETDVSRQIGDLLIAEGHDAAGDAVVASGPNSASPHHATSERVIQAGEPVVLDFGGTVGGYNSDMTRTMWATGPEERMPDPAFVHLYETVRAAHAAAVAAVHPGVSCESVDRAARDHVTDAGYGPYFLHRTGHGIGLEVHEEPYIVAGNGEALEAGMAFSIEPGIYLEGRYGARLEDIVVCTAEGTDLLNQAPRDLAVVPG